MQREKRYRVDCKDKYITIYESNVEVDNVQGLFDSMGSLAGLSTDTNAISNLSKIMDKDYTAMLRFYLEDKEKRTFSVERFCFRGAFDKWIYLDQSDNFRNLAKQYIELLGTDKFFESPYY